MIHSIEVLLIVNAIALALAVAGCATVPPRVGCYGYADQTGQHQMFCGVQTPI